MQETSKFEEHGFFISAHTKIKVLSYRSIFLAPKWVYILQDVSSRYGKIAMNLSRVLPRKVSFALIEDENDHVMPRRMTSNWKKHRKIRKHECFVRTGAS